MTQPTRVLTYPDTVLDLDRRILRTPAGESSLTAMEHKALCHLADHVGDNVTRKDLERDVWGFRAGTRSETVPVTMRRLRARIEVDPRNPRILFTVRGVGWRLARPPPAVPASPALPRMRTPFHDRPAELDALRSLLDTGWTLVTLVGPGGIGKTRLAAELVQRTPGAVYAALGAARTGSDVRQALMDALGAHDAERSTLERALTLRDVRLIVLDQVEDVVAPVIDALEWLATLVGAVVATSRRPLGLDGEAVLDVPPLDPDAGRAFLADRLSASRWQRDVDPATLDATVAALEGIPLALEVAAARPQDLSGLLEALQTGAPALPRMDQAIARSWSALSTDDQLLLQAISLVTGTIADDELRSWRGLGADLGPLADRSLIAWDAGRWRVSRTTRSFVRRQPGPWDDLRTSYRDWLVRHAQELIEPLAASRRSALHACIALLPDMEEVLQGSDDGHAAAMAGALAYLLNIRGSPRVAGLVRMGLARRSTPLLHALAAALHVDDRPDEHLILAEQQGDASARILAATVRVWRDRSVDRGAITTLTGTEPGQHMDLFRASLWAAWTHPLPRHDPDREAMRLSVRPYPLLAAQLEDRLATLAWHADDPAAAHRHARLAREISDAGITPNERVRGRMPEALLLAIDDPAAALTAIRSALTLTEPVGELTWTRLLRTMEVGVLFTLERDDEARTLFQRLPGEDHTPWARQRYALTGALLGLPHDVPDELAAYVALGRARDALLAGDPTAAERLASVLADLDKPPRLFLASLLAYTRRLIASA